MQQRQCQVELASLQHARGRFELRAVKDRILHVDGREEVAGEEPPRIARGGDGLIVVVLVVERLAVQLPAVAEEAVLRAELICQDLLRSIDLHEADARGHLIHAAGLEAVADGGVEQAIRAPPRR